jgi:acyl-CoA thioester hydrolase
MSREQFWFFHPFRVRYSEIDGQGVVFNAHWLTYFDEACTRFFDALGFREEWVDQFDVMLVKVVLEWQGSARFDEFVDIVVRPSRLGTKSFDLRYDASVDENPVCIATITYVSVKPGANTSVEIPPHIRAALEPRVCT